MFSPPRFLLKGIPMLKKLKNVLNHPLLSPLVDPVKASVNFGISLIKEPYIKAFKEGVERAERYHPGTNPYIKGWQSLFNADHLLPFMGNSIGTACTTIFGAVVGFSMAPSAVLAGAGIIAGGAIGLASGPFIMGAIGFAGGTAIGSLVAGVPALVKSIGKIAKHIKDPKAYSASLQPPASQSPAPVATPAPAPTPVLTADDISRSIDALSEKERAALLEQLGEKHKGTFEEIQDKKIAGDFSRGTTQEIQTPVIPEIKKRKIDSSGPQKKSA